MDSIFTRKLVSPLSFVYAIIYYSQKDTNDGVHMSFVYKKVYDIIFFPNKISQDFYISECKDPLNHLMGPLRVQLGLDRGGYILNEKNIFGKYRTFALLPTKYVSSNNRFRARWCA